MGLESVKKAAKSGNWKIVDREIPSLAQDSRTVIWAWNEGVSSKIENFRDLGASILEKAPINNEAWPEIRDKLVPLLHDTAPYIRFRAACALAAHEPGEYRTQVIITLQDFMNDSEKDVVKIAKTYLKQLS